MRSLILMLVLVLALTATAWADDGKTAYILVDNQSNLWCTCAPDWQANAVKTQFLRDYGVTLTIIPVPLPLPIQGRNQNFYVQVLPSGNPTMYVYRGWSLTRQSATDEVVAATWGFRHKYR